MWIFVLQLMFVCAKIILNTPTSPLAALIADEWSNTTPYPPNLLRLVHLRCGQPGKVSLCGVILISNYFWGLKVLVSFTTSWSLSFAVQSSGLKTIWIKQICRVCAFEEEVKGEG
jgi:hypothetical protein